jgi:very-short-patch-repair endonuclease
MRGLRLHEARRARGLRQDQSEAERQLWRRLRNRALGGFKFVRQEPIGPYFADFVCREESLSSRSTARLIRPMTSAAAI